MAPAELWVQQCNNLFASGIETLDAVTCCADTLKRLHLLDLHCHASREALDRLGALTQVYLSLLLECIPSEHGQALFVLVHVARIGSWGCFGRCHDSCGW